MTNLTVKNMILADNKNSISLNGGSSSDQRFPLSLIEDVVIFGKALGSCTFCYKDASGCNNSGIYSSLYDTGNYNLAFTNERLPLHNTTVTFYLSGGP